MCYFMTKMFTSQTIITLAVLTSSVAFADASSHSLRGASTIYIHGDVTLQHLLGKVNNTELRRLNELVPVSKAIAVPCLNATSDCGMHGQCRISGENKFCQCDGRYVSLEMDKPCAVEGANQVVMLLMWIMFGWTGGSMFGLGLSLFGSLMLCLFCCGICCRAAGEGTGESKSNLRCEYIIIAALMFLAGFGLWIYGLVIMSTNKCVDSRGVPCGW